MKKKYEPCAICEEYIEGVDCTMDQCPVAKLKAENERLKDYNDNLQSANAALSCTLLDEVEKAKIEVVKELAIRFDEIVTGIYNKHIFGYDLYDGEEEAVMDYAVDITCAFENLVKEMTEGNNG